MLIAEFDLQSDKGKKRGWKRERERELEWKVNHN